MNLTGSNPNWHELRKREKCLSLVPPKSKFYKTQWAWQSVKLTRLMSIFTSKKGWKFFIQIQLTKSNPKITRGVKVTCLMPNRVEADVKSFKEKQKQKFRRMSYLLHATIISFFLYFLLCFHIFLTFWVTLIIGWCVSCLSYLVQCVIKKPKAASFKPSTYSGLHV